MIPVIALVGRPNVGKSTLFNCFTKSRDALVADWPGLTRDRQYGEGRWGDHRFLVVDTGGLTGDEAGLFSEMAKQAELAIAESDVVAFLVDARAGVTVVDHQLAKQLRATGKPIQLVVNKTDGLSEDTVLADFFELGLGDPLAIAASHQRGVSQLLQTLLERCPEKQSLLPDDEPEDRMRLAVIGRPNVGKSTLVNRLLGEDRMVVYDQPGTTMDSIAMPLNRNGEIYTLIDTAGVRRRKNMHEVVEKFSVIKTLQAIQSANVVVMLLNAQEGVVEQDLHILQHVLKAGRAVVLGVNKWDHLSLEQKEDMKRDLSRRMTFMHWADLHFISAKHGTHVGALFRSAQKAVIAAMGQWSTHFLTEILQGLIQEHQPPMVHGRRIKLRYAHQGGKNPPIIVVHGNQVEHLPGSYKRYLENAYTEVLQLRGTPVRLEFRQGGNPYATPQGRVASRKSSPTKRSSSRRR